MTAKIINILEHIKGEQQDSRRALMAALERPFDEPVDRTALTTEFTAAWLMRGLWMEGYKIVPVEVPDDG